MRAHIVLQSFIERESDALMLSASACFLREDPSSFIRRAMRMELARLGFLGEEEMQALGIADDR